MGFFDDIFGSKSKHDGWTATHRAILKEVSYDEIVSELGSPRKSKGFVYWRGPLSEIDPDYDDNEFYQISNKDFRGFGGPAKKPSIDGETWFIYSTSPHAIRIVCNEIGALARDIEGV